MGKDAGAAATAGPPAALARTEFTAPTPGAKKHPNGGRATDRVTRADAVAETEGMAKTTGKPAGLPFDRDGRRRGAKVGALALALAAAPAGCAVQTTVNIDNARETLVGQWRGMSRHERRDLYEVRVREISDSGQIEGRGCIMFTTDVMATVSLVHANLEDEQGFVTKTGNLEIRFAINDPKRRGAIVQLTPLGRQVPTDTTHVRLVDPGTETICLHRFSDEPVTATGVEPSAEHPMIGQWTETEEHEGAIVELEFAELHEDGKTMTGRKCTRDYEHHGMRLMDLGAGRRTVPTTMHEDGRTVTTTMYLHGGRVHEDVYTLNNNDTLTHTWQTIERSGKVFRSGESTKRRGAREDGCLAHTTRRTG